MPSGWTGAPRYRDIEGLTPLSVITYIAAQGLYEEVVATPAASAVASPARSPVSSMRRGAPGESVLARHFAGCAAAATTGAAMEEVGVVTARARAGRFGQHVFAALPVSNPGSSTVDLLVATDWVAAAYCEDDPPSAADSSSGFDSFERAIEPRAAVHARKRGAAAAARDTGLAGEQ